MLTLSRLHLDDLSIPKNATKAKFIKYLNDKTVVFNNQIITGLLLLRTHSCKHCQTRVTVEKNLSKFEVRFRSVRGKLMLFNIIEKKVR